MMLRLSTITATKRRSRAARAAVTLFLLLAVAFNPCISGGSTSRHQLPPPPPPLHHPLRSTVEIKPPPPPDHNPSKQSRESQESLVAGKLAQPPPPPTFNPDHGSELELITDSQNVSSNHSSPNKMILPPPPPPPQGNHDRRTQSQQPRVDEKLAAHGSRRTTNQDLDSQSVSSLPILVSQEGRRTAVDWGSDYQQNSERAGQQPRRQHHQLDGSRDATGTLQRAPAQELQPSFHQLHRLQQHQQEMKERYNPDKHRLSNQIRTNRQPRFVPTQQTRMPNGPQIAYHQSAPPRQTGRASSGILKSLWHRVEKGLDGLADVEDAVADRAKGIGNAIATRTTTLVARRSHVPSSNEPPRTIPQPPVRKFKKEQIDKPSVTASDNLIGSFGAKYKNIKAGSLKRRNEAKYEHLKTQSRKLDWNNIASGGRQVVGGDTSRRTVTEAPPSSWYSQQQQTHPQQQQPIRPPRPLASGDAATEPLMQAQDSSVPSSHPVPDDDDDDDDVYLGEKPSLFSKISMPRLPRLPSPIMRLLGKGSGSFNSRTQAAMEQWKDSESSIRRNKPRRYQTSKGTSGLASTSSIPDPVANLLNRSSKRPGSLLTNRDASKAKFVGQQQALFDVAFLLFFLIGIHQLLPSFADAGLILPRSLSELWSVTLPKVSTVLLSALQQESWMLYAAAGAFLTTISRIVLIDGQKDVLANSVGTAVERMTRYSQLYKRLVGSIPIDRRSQGRMRDAVESEVRDLVAGNRLQSFVITTMIAMVVMTVPVVMPICEALWRGIIRVIAMDGWHSWPLPYQEIAEGLKNIALSQFGQISTLISAEVPKALDNPMLVLFQVTTVAALLILAGPPAVARRGAGPTQEVDDDEEEEEYLIRTAESLRGTLNNLGSSSAARLGVLSKKGAAGSALERWWSAFPSDPSRSRSFSPLTFLRQVGFGLAATALAASPAVVYFVALHPTASCCPSGLIPPFRWDSVVDVSFLMLAALSLSWQAIRAGLAVSDTRSQTVDFITQLASLTTEVAGNTDLSTETQFGSTIVPAKGLSVRDLWASHAFVSAWAVRGANLDCAGGEVILVLGDEASGKTRLLTAVAESIIAPPRTALTTTKVRGTVSICGVDVSKWDQGMLKRRLGLLLSDVRSQSDVADLLSGMTVGEILEPVVGSVMSQSNVAAKRSAISQAMKITGLTSTLQRFPAKLGAVLSPKEDEVVPSDARPSSNLLSPSEWSKLLLTRVVAQAIHDNDSVSTDYLLLGSVLILDGVLSWMNEVDEARLIQKLRSTGAASVLTSHKWATGRFADRVCVVKDGAVIESGSHAELLSRGPQGSLYAAKWLAMSQS